MSLYALDLQASPALVGMLMGLFALFPMLLAVNLGRWIDRVGVARPMTVGAFCMVLGTGVAFVLPQLATLFLVAILLGTGHIMIQVAGQHAVGLLSAPEHRAGNFGHLSTAYSIANFCGAISAGFAIEAVGHRYTFLIYVVVVGLGLLLLATRAIGIPPHQHIQRPPNSGSAFNLLRNPVMRPIYIIGILQAAAWDIYVFIVPIHGTQLGFSPSTIGIILASFSIGTLVVRVFMPWIHRHQSEWQVLRFAMVAGALSYLVLPFMAQSLPFVVLSFFLGVALGSGQPNLLSLLHLAAPPGRGGEALGLRLTISNGGQVLLPLAFGAATTAMGIMPLFWAFATILGFGTRVAHREVRLRGRHPH